MLSEHKKSQGGCGKFSSKLKMQPQASAGPAVQCCFSTEVTNKALEDPGVQLLRHILLDTASRVVFITGAGISVKSGVPLYRSTGDASSSHESDKSESSGARAGDNRDRQLVQEEGLYVSISDTELDFKAGKSVDHQEPEGQRNRQGQFKKSTDKRPPRAQPSAIWDSKLEGLARRSSFLVDPRSWYRYFWFDTHHVDAFLQASPNEVHFALGLLCQKYPNRIHCCTQNVDRLHQKGGCPLESLIEVHGRIGVYRCIGEECPNGSKQPLYWNQLEFLSEEEERAMYGSRPEDLDNIRQVYETEAGKASNEVIDVEFPLPCCPLCRQVAIPMTLLFDENYQTHDFFQFEKACGWVKDADVLVFIGTSFAVWFTEYAISSARYDRKLVFNINIVEASGAFAGFANALSTNNPQAPPHRRSAWKHYQEDSAHVHNADENIAFNWDSNSDNEESPSNRIRLAAETRASRHSLDPTSLRHAAICQITMPSDIACTAAIGETLREVLKREVDNERLARWRRMWTARE